MKTINAIGLLALVAFMSAFTLKNNNDHGGYHIGSKVKDFSLESISGKKVSLADYKEAKGYIITFTCNTCPYAVAYEDRIEALNKKYASKGFPVVAIMPNNTDVKPGDDLAAMKVRAKEKGFTFEYVIDKDQSVYPEFGATKTPHIFVVEKTKGGNIVKYIGAIDDNYRDANAVKTKYVENAVNALLAGKEIETKETRAIGCGIKR